MEVGDRVTVTSGPCLLWEGELVQADPPRVWFPERNVTRQFTWGQLAALTSAFDRRPKRERRRR
jgi:hypothetical protein